MSSMINVPLPTANVRAPNFTLFYPSGTRFNIAMSGHIHGHTHEPISNLHAATVSPLRHIYKPTTAHPHPSTLTLVGHSQSLGTF